MKTSKYTLIKIAIIVILCQTLSATILLETANQNYSNGGPGLGFRGSRFSITVPTRIMQVSTPMLAFDTMGVEIESEAFLVPLTTTSVYSMPFAQTNVDSIRNSALAASALTIPNPGGVQPFGTNVELNFSFDTILMPGVYGVVFAGETNGMPSSTPLISSNNTNFYGYAGGSWSALADNFRFVVIGEVVPEPSCVFTLGVTIIFVTCRRKRNQC